MVRQSGVGFVMKESRSCDGSLLFRLPVVLSTAGKLADKGVLVSLYAGSGSRIEGKTWWSVPWVML